MHRPKRLAFICIASFGMLCAACREQPPGAPPATSASPAAAPPTQRVVGPLSDEDARALATMNDRIKAYLVVHDKLEKGLPALPDEATPQQIDRNQREFERRMRAARTDVRQGDIFTPEAQPVIKRLLATLFSGPEGKALKASIMDENPVDPVQLRVEVNARYPDTVPLTTIPPDILQTLPKLTEDLEDPFVGDWLILLDTHAHTIADYVRDALPN